MRHVLLSLLLALSTTACSKEQPKADATVKQVATMTVISVDTEEGAATLIDKKSVKKTNDPYAFSSRVGVYFRNPIKDDGYEVQMVLMDVIVNCAEEKTAITNELFLDSTGKVSFEKDLKNEPIVIEPQQGSYFWVLSVATCRIADDKFSNQPNAMGT